MEAQRLGLAGEVHFLRWFVRCDADFFEHWALKINPEQALDLTAAQIDGDPTPMRLIASYPSHFGQPRQYPIDWVLPYFQPGPSGGDRQIDPVSLWRLHRSIFRHHWTEAKQNKSVGDLARAGYGVMSEALRLGSAWLLEKAIVRRSHLLRKLQ